MSKLSRRDLISSIARIAGLSGAFSAMQAMGLMAEAGPYSGPPATPANLGRGRRVVILGAGIGGMTAGYELRKAGFDVTILEASARPGGRVWTLRGGSIVNHTHLPSQRCNFGTGHYFNAGAARIPASHQGVHAYCREFSVPLEVQVNVNRSAKIVDANVEGGTPLTNRQVVSDLRGGLAELLSKAVTRGALDDELTATDRERLMDFLASFGALESDGRYIGSERDGYEIEPTVHGAETRLVAPLPMKELLKAEGWGFLLSFGETLYQQSTMLQPVGGMDAIPYAFAARLRREIQYGCKVSHLTKTADGVRVLYSRSDGTAGAVDADYCVCALPFSVLKGVEYDAAPAVRRAIDQMEYGASCKVAWESERFWEREDRIYGGLSYADTRSLMTWYPSYDFNAERGVLVGTYNFDEDAAAFSTQTVHQQAEESRASVERIHPGRGVMLQKPVVVNWAKVPLALGAWAQEGPEHNYDTTEMRQVLSGDGPIVFTGQHLSPIGAWMEAAIRASHVAVGQVFARAAQP